MQRGPALHRGGITDQGANRFTGGQRAAGLDERLDHDRARAAEGRAAFHAHQNGARAAAEGIVHQQFAGQHLQLIVKAVVVGSENQRARTGLLEITAAGDRAGKGQ